MAAKRSSETESKTMRQRSPAAKKSKPAATTMTIGSAAAVAAAEAAKVPTQALKPGEKVHCSFCGVSNFDCDMLIASPLNQAFICALCVEVCRDIVGVHRSGPRAA